MEKSYNYSDIYLVPKYSELKTRKDADISVEFLGYKFKSPWIPANMSSVLNEENAKWLSENGYFYIYHRFSDTEAFVEKANKENWRVISISVGVKDQDKELLRTLLIKKAKRIDFITIDIAHSHSILAKEMIHSIMDTLSKRNRVIRPRIIAGNVCTPEAVRDLAEWGADAVKVGIAGGGACSTKNMTGFHIPMFSCVNDCCNYKDLIRRNYQKLNFESMAAAYQYADSLKDIPIIADGGIRENGDIAKALVAGASMVMAGSIFAACTDAPGENIHKDNPVFISTNFGNDPFKLSHYGNDGPITHKRYYGSASAKQKGEKKNVEGFELEIPCNGLTYAEKYQELTESLQSSVSYAGGKDLKSLKNVKWITVK